LEDAVDDLTAKKLRKTVDYLKDELKRTYESGDKKSYVQVLKVIAEIQRTDAYRVVFERCP
jgi:hypothetical protein